MTDCINGENNTEIQYKGNHIFRSSVGKKLATVHFTRIPCKPNTDHWAQRKLYFCIICLCTNDIVYARFEEFRTFLYVFLSVVKFFVR